MAVIDLTRFAILKSHHSYSQSEVATVRTNNWNASIEHLKRIWHIVRLLRADVKT